MKARVYLMRQRGRRVRGRAEYDSYQGTLSVDATVHGNTLCSAAHLRTQDPRGSHTEEVITPLYEPVLVALGDGVILLRGYESREGTGFVQEWRCVLEHHAAPEVILAAAAGNKRPG